MKTKQSKRSGRWTAKDPDYPRVVGRGATEDEAIEDLEDKLAEAAYADEFEASLGWPEEGE